MTSLRANQNFTVIDWRCETCGRSGIAAFIERAALDEDARPGNPGDAAFVSHRMQQPEAEHERCRRPSLTWTRRRP